MSMCANCGKPQDEHYAVNYSDGPHVSGPVLICPTSLYQLARDKPKTTRKASQ